MTKQAIQISLPDPGPAPESRGGEDPDWAAAAPGEPLPSKQGPPGTCDGISCGND